MTPYEIVRSHYTFPFELYPFQVDVVNELAPLPRQAEWADPGTGKTSMSTHIALYQVLEQGVDTVVVAMPPLLISMWSRWLAKIKRNGKPIPVTVYRGEPKLRKKITLSPGFILLSLPIFKKDFSRFEAELADRRVLLIVDEAQSLKSIDSDNHKKVNEFCLQGHGLMELSGTPLSTPLDGYAHCKLKSPGIYRNLRQFTNIHVAKWDFWEKPEEYANLDLLASNMRVNAVRILKEEVLQDLPPVTYMPLHYELSAPHRKLYRQIAEEQLVKLEEGGKLDLTNASALRHALEQLIMSPAYFSQDPDMLPAGYDLIEEIMDELGDKKLIVFSNYRRTNGQLLERYKDRYGAVAIYGDVKAKDKDANLARFLDDPTCRMLLGQPTSLGVGVDGAQHVCSEVLYMEFPGSTLLNQSMSRVYRDGQRHAVTVRVAVAEGTLQVRRYENLLLADELITTVTGGWKSLREYVFGN